MAVKFSTANFNDYKPLREVIFDTLREAIIAGELKPGERLMEMELSKKMGISRTPIREAIRKLELEGLVRMVPRKGTHVTELNIKDIMDVLEVRANLDELATSLSASRITADELKELKNVSNQFIRFMEKGNIQGQIKKDIEFHDIIYRSSRNEKLLQILSNLRELVYRFRVIYLKDYASSETVIKEHEDIYEALSDGNPSAAGRIAGEHVGNQKETIIRSVKNVHAF